MQKQFIADALCGCGDMILTSEELPLSRNFEMSERSDVNKGSKILEMFKSLIEAQPEMLRQNSPGVCESLGKSSKTTECFTSWN